MNSTVPDEIHDENAALSPLLALIASVLRDSKSSPQSNELAMLGYGTGKSEDSLSELQQNLLEQLLVVALDSLPESARVVLNGPSMPALVNKLTGRCADILVVHESLPAIESLQVSGSESVNFLGTDFLQADLPASVDLVIIEGTVGYLDQMAVLQRARSVLTDSGRLVFLAEFLEDDSRIEASELANLSSFHQLGERLGFKLLGESDFSEGAKLSLDKFMALLDDWRDSGCHDDLLEQSIAELELMRREFAEGRRVLRLATLAFAPSPGQTYLNIEYAAPGSFQPEAISNLFESSFNTDFDAEIWHWKYETGKGRCVVAKDLESNSIICHYGGAPRKIHYFGKPALAIQVCDVMALPEIRRHYGKDSLFFKTAATFLEREIGNTVSHLLGFGFPNQKAMNIAKRLGLYEKTDDFIELVFNELDGQNAWQVTPMDNLDGITADLNKLWQRMAGDFQHAIIGLRDSEYFQYRYFDHPAFQRGQYYCLAIRDSENRLQAVAVVKQHEQQWLLMELLTARENIRKAIPEIQAWIKVQAEAGPLKFWLTKGWLDAMNGLDFAVNELGIEIPCNSWNPGPPSGILYGKWWLTAGDMDFQ